MVSGSLLEVRQELRQKRASPTQVSRVACDYLGQAGFIRLIRLADHHGMQHPSSKKRIQGGPDCDRGSLPLSAKHSYETEFTGAPTTSTKVGMSDRFR